MKNQYYVTKYDVKADNAFALEDNIMVKDGLTTAGSKMLHNYISPIDATVVRKLLDKGMELAGKTKLDEFAVMGVSGDNNELSGVVGAVLDKTCRIALCNDVFGKVRRQAAENCLYYIRPTYGTVSRFGLVQTVSSMDQIGIVCGDLDEGIETLSVIAGHDENDSTTQGDGSLALNSKGPLKEGKYTIGIPVNVMNKTDEKSKEAIKELASKYHTEEFELEHFEALSQVMYILSSAEIGNNTSRYDGVKFGYRSENYEGLKDLYTNSRTEGFGLNMKLTSIIGAMVLSSGNYEKFYLKAMKIRRQIKEQCDELFKGFDAIAMPLTLDSQDPYVNLALYALAPLCGLPSLSVPLGSNNGVQLISQAMNENVLFDICKGGR